MGNSVFLRNPAETTRINKEPKSLDNNSIVNENNSTIDKFSGFDQDYAKKEDETLFGFDDYTDVDYTVGDDKNNDIFA